MVKIKGMRTPDRGEGEIEQLDWMGFGQAAYGLYVDVDGVGRGR